MHSLLVVVVLVAYFNILMTFTHAFSFSTTTPTECRPLTVNWQGGEPPFTILILPIFAPAKNMTIPDENYSETTRNGSYSFPLSVPRSKQFVLTMSDATGYASGGSTPVLTVAPGAASACNTTVSPPPFFFQANSALQQCRPFVFSNYTNATLPIHIIVTVPAGTSQQVHPPANATSYSWIANAPTGTSLLFSLFDDKGQSGGSTDVRIVGISDDTTCLSSDPLTSTSISSPTSTGGANSPTSPSDSGNGVSSATTAAISVSVVSFIAVVFAIGFFFYRRRKQSQQETPPKPRPHVVDPFPPHTHVNSFYSDVGSSVPLQISPAYDQTQFTHPDLVVPPSYQASIHNSPRHVQSQNTLSSSTQSRPLSSNPEVPWDPYTVNLALPPGPSPPQAVHKSTGG